MCLVLPARVIARSGAHAEVQYADGERAEVDASRVPEALPGTTVLVDRGVILELVSEEDADLIMQVYADMAT